jgi:hypothetical protein
LLPVGYAAGLDAYRAAVAGLAPSDLTDHYTRGLAFFHEELVPAVKARLRALSGGALALDDYVGFAAGSDCDFMTHLVEAVAAHSPVRIYPGDWYGFKVGCTQQERIEMNADSAGAALSCLCIPSVRNGHLTDEMVGFLEGAEACLLNLNLYPTLVAEERRAVAEALAPLLPRSVLSISFSRGFGLTASQLGVALVHRGHPFVARFATQWRWHTYFFNAIAARAFLRMDLDRLAAVDDARRRWVAASLAQRGLPALASGSYYVRAFRLEGTPAAHLAPLVRDGVVRLCFKPPQE